MIKIGDNVRFLNAVGGGIVKKIDFTKNLVYVEDVDGFEVPALIKECVAIPKINANTNFPTKDFSKTTQPSMPEIEPEAIDSALKEKLPLVETLYGDKLTAFLAFFANDIKQMQTSNHECYLVNDSNYYILYNIAKIEEKGFVSIKNGLIEPNTQEIIADITKQEVNNWQYVRVQLIPYKKEKVYNTQVVIDKTIKINPVKFFKLHSFTANDYFDDPAMMIDLSEDEDEKMTSFSNITGKEIKEAMLQKESRERTVISQKKHQSNLIEIDLHSHELLDNTIGMSSAEILGFQLDKFKETIKMYQSKKGTKIVFIHGKGEGVLRSEIEKILKTKFKSFSYQDASFKEYGFGATLVTIK